MSECFCNEVPFKFRKKFSVSVYETGHAFFMV